MGKKKLVEISATELKKLRNKVASQEKKAAKKAVRKIDGLNAHTKQRIKNTLRDLWRQTEPWKLVKKRVELPEGFFKCESCQQRVPKVFIDHIQAVGALDSGFIDRMFVSSVHLQALCVSCHKEKTKQDLANMRGK